MITRMKDPLASFERSALMAKVRGKGNRSTEFVVERSLRVERIAGWTKHPGSVPGKPDFYFPAYKLALFVDGCFWHGCPKCARNIPTNRRLFWRTKLDGNRRRDRYIRRLFNRRGYHVMRVWEHHLVDRVWLQRLRDMIRRIERVDSGGCSGGGGKG